MIDLELRRIVRQFQAGDTSVWTKIVAWARRSRTEGFQVVSELIRNDVYVLCSLLNFRPTEQQCKLLNDVQARKKRIAVKSGQGTGKSTVAVVIAIWRVLQAEGSRVIVTAPSMRQCQDVFMFELRRLLGQANPILKGLFRVTTRKAILGKRKKKDDDEDDRPDWGIHCVTASDPVNAQGYHGDNLTFIVDEASGVDRPFIQQIEGTLSQATGDMLHLQTGNPNSADGAFYDAFHTKREFWSCHTFDARESPIVSEEHCRYMEKSYGRESDVVRVRVYGQFPSMAPNAIISMDDLERCTQTSKLLCSKLSRKRQFGIDLARMGADESVIYRRSGESIIDCEWFSKCEPDDVVARAFAMQAENGWSDEECFFVPDADGMGQGVMGMFHKAHKQVLEFHNNGTATNSEMYGNRITEAYFNFAAKAKAGRCHIPNDPRLLQQLATRCYGIRRTDGKILLESKDDYKKRTELDSPDRADALVMAFYDQEYIDVNLLSKGVA